MQVLETLTKFVPGNLAAQTLLAKAKVLAGDSDAAAVLLETCLNIDPACAGAYLQLAKIKFAARDINAALRVLEQALARDFSMKTHPLYCLVKARVLQEQRADRNQ